MGQFLFWLVETHADTGRGSDRTVIVTVGRTVLRQKQRCSGTHSRVPVERTDKVPPPGNSAPATSRTSTIQDLGEQQQGHDMQGLLGPAGTTTPSGQPVGTVGEIT